MRRRRGRSAFLQRAFDIDHAVGRRIAAGTDDQFDGARNGFGDRLVHRRQRRIGETHDRRVVEAYQRKVARDDETELSRGVERCERHLVAAGDDGGDGGDEDVLVEAIKKESISLSQERSKVLEKKIMKLIEEYEKTTGRMNRNKQKMMKAKN